MTGDTGSAVWVWAEVEPEREVVSVELWLVRCPKCGHLSGHDRRFVEVCCHGGGSHAYREGQEVTDAD